MTNSALDGKPYAGNLHVRINEGGRRIGEAEAFVSTLHVKGLKPYYVGLRNTVRVSKFLNLLMPVPSLEEQEEIVAYIEREMSKLEILEVLLERQIALLKEYRTRLILDAVTGRIDLRKEAC